MYSLIKQRVKIGKVYSGMMQEVENSECRRDSIMLHENM